jgi:hypothetical protein
MRSGRRLASSQGRRVSSEATAAAEARESTFSRSPAEAASRAAEASSGPASTRARKPRCTIVSAGGSGV